MADLLYAATYDSSKEAQIGQCMHRCPASTRSKMMVLLGTRLSAGLLDVVTSLGSVSTLPALGL